MATSVLLIGDIGLLLLRTDALVCESCFKEVEVGEWPYCPHSPVHPRPIFPSFEFEGRVIDSLQAATRIERETDSLYRDGRGAPVRFRAFHQDSSNYDCNTFGPSPQVQTPKSARNKTGFGEQAKNREVHPAVRRLRGD